jgi:hypothetical protein
MTRTIRPNPTDLQNNTDLDMRVSSSQGTELKEEINHSVEHSQLFLTTTLPNRLILTQKQFISLQDDMERYYDTEDRFYKTPSNIMEVVIDRDIDTVQDVDQAIETYKEIKEEMTDHDSNPNPDQPDSRK